MKIHVCGGANLVPIAVFWSTNLASLIRSSAEICLDSRFSRVSSNAFKPSSCGILGYSPTTSAVTSKEFSGRFPICLIFLKNSPESLMYDQLLCMTCFKWWSKNSDAFSVRVPQLDIIGGPGALKSFLQILGRKYNFPKLVAFL